MLRRLRRNAKPEARLLFSLKPELASPDPEVRKRTEPAIARVLEHRAAQEDSRLIDEVPDHPLQIAGYEPEYALALVDGTGWKMLESAPARAIHPALHALVIEE